MTIRKYSFGGTTYWKVDEWVTGADGMRRRVRQSKIPTRELAAALAADRLLTMQAGSPARGSTPRGEVRLQRGGP